MTARARPAALPPPLDPRLAALCLKAARSPLPVLIEGERGAGKRFHALAIHRSGDRAAKPFVTLDCAALTWGKADAAVFGLDRTGAGSDPGAFREAQGGTLLLKEVGDLPPETQARLMQALETGEILPVGARRPVRTNVRLIAASRTRLLNLAHTGEFREDLYYRLSALPIYVPPLRERPAAVAAIAAPLLAAYAAELGRPAAALSAEAMTLLAAHDWPGNVRELQTSLLRAVALAESGQLEPADFPHLLVARDGRAVAAVALRDLAVPSAPVHIDNAIPRRKQTEGSGHTPDRFLTTAGEITPLVVLERELIAFALGRYRGHMSRIARALGIGRSTLYRKLRDHGLDAALESDGV